MKITIEVEDDVFEAIADAVAAKLNGGPGVAAAPPKEVKRDRGQLIGLINGLIKDADTPQIAKQNRAIIKEVFGSLGAEKVPDLKDNEIGEAYRLIEEKCNG